MDPLRPTALAITRAIGGWPNARAASPLRTDSAAAPSLMPLEVAAVTVPSLRKAGFSLASASVVTPARGCSSIVNRVVPPLPSGTATGTNSSAKTPAANAA